MTDAGLLHLPGLNRLQQLVLNNTQVTMPTSHCRAVRFFSAVLAITLSIAAGQVALPQNSDAAPAKSADADSGDFYRVDEVQSIYLRVAEEDWQRMLAALPERIY